MVKPIDVQGGHIRTLPHALKVTTGLIPSVNEVVEFVGRLASQFIVVLPFVFIRWHLCREKIISV